MEVEARDVGGGGEGMVVGSRIVGLGGVGESDVGGVIIGLEGVGVGIGSKGLVGVKGRGGTGGLSDEEDPSFDGDGGDGLGGGHSGLGKNKKSSSPWQRMKWTDAMVKLLISVVLFIGEDVVGVDGNSSSSTQQQNQQHEGNKRKSGILQKKGKWKSVSKVMMEKGCYVSPQQCEDKFNDLNKRYKRLNDILGKSTACNVVENPPLLDGLSTLTPKAKEDVRKILSSKHLFYKEMAFYHNGNKAALATDLEFQQPQFQTAMIQSREMIEGGRQIRDDMDDDDDDDDENGEDEDVDDEYDLADGVEEDTDPLGDLSDPFGKRRKLSKKLEEVELGMAASGLHDYGTGKEITGVELMNPADLMGVLQDSSKVSREHQQQWMRSRTMQLEEQKVGLQAEAFNLEKQRFKWQKFSCKKDREIERMRLENERIKLENERMLIELRQKELENDHRRSDASMTNIALILDRLQEREQNDLGRGQCVQ